MLLAVKIYLVLLWIFLSMIEIWEASSSFLLSIQNIIDKSLGIEGKFCSSPCVSILWIIHLVKLVSVIVVTIHGNNQSFNIVFILKCFLDLLAKIALTRRSCAGNTNKWNYTSLFANNVLDIFCLLDYQISWLWSIFECMFLRLLIVIAADFLVWLTIRWLDLLFKLLLVFLETRIGGCLEHFLFHYRICNIVLNSELVIISC